MASFSWREHTRNSPKGGTIKVRRIQARVRSTGRRPIIKTFSNMTDAKAWARQMEADLDRGVTIVGQLLDQTTFADLLIHYRDKEAIKLKSEQSIQNAQREVEDLLCHPISRRRLSNQEKQWQQSRQQYGITHD